MFELLLKGFFETLFMVGVSSAAAFCVGTPFALYLWTIGPKGLKQKPVIYGIGSFFINALRSIPYLIFLVLLIPVTRLIAGTSIGTLAASVPLSLAAILLYTRLAEEAFNTMSPGLIEAGKVMGATKIQILSKIVFTESLPQLIASLTNLIVMIIGFSAMAGAVGGGGLGDLAYRYGYQRYDLVFLTIIVIVLILMVQCVQWCGDRLVKHVQG